MPWSEWQTSDVSVAVWENTAGIGAPFDRNTGSAPFDTTHVSANPSNDGPTVSWTATETEGGPELAHGVAGSGVQVALPPDWDATRDWFPDLLWDLDFGTEYAVRPDRTAGDTDAYVQYEDAASDPLETVASGFDIVNSGAGYPSPFQVGIDFGTTYTPTADLPGWPGVGGVIFSGDATTDYTGTSLDGSVPVGSMFPAGGYQSFTLAVHFTGPEPEPIPGGQSSLVVISNPLVFTRYRMPRWRYWIPGEDAPPLRQKQRNDGMLRGVMRARSTSSIQNSVRQNSYR